MITQYRDERKREGGPPELLRLLHSCRSRVEDALKGDDLEAEAEEGECRPRLSTSESSEVLCCAVCLPGGEVMLGAAE